MPKPETDAVAVYSPESMQRLVRYLWNSRNEPKAQSALLYVVLGAFAGLRPAESVALEWKSVDCTGLVISLPTPTAKIARSVSMKSNLLEFLLPYKHRTGLVIIHKKVANLLRNECMEAGVTHISNGLRRSYAAYRLAESSEDIVRVEMGLDAPPQEGWPVVTAEAAASYWAITP